MRAKKREKYVANTIFRFFTYFILLFLKVLLDLPEAFWGFSLIIGGGLFVVQLIKDKLLVTPIVLGEALLVSFGLYELHLVNTMTYMSTETIVVVLLSIFTWEFVCVLCKSMYVVRDDADIKWPKGDSNLALMIIITFFVSSLIIILEWLIAGGIPILRNDVETFRFKVVFNSTLHVIGMCMKYIPFLVAIYCKFDIKFMVKKHKFICLVFLASLLFLIATSFRGELMISLCMMALVYFIYRKPKLKFVIKIAIFFGVIMAVYPLFRSYVLYGNNYIESMKAISTYPKVWFLTPLYQTFASSFHYFNKDIVIFPDLVNFGMGQYTILSEIPFYKGVETLAETQNRVWNNGFYAELTATIFGSLYADFGYIGCIMGLGIISSLCNYLYHRFICKKTIKTLVIYIFVFYKGFQMIYDNTFGFIAILYYLYLWLIFTIRFKTSKRRPYPIEL